MNVIEKLIVLSAWLKSDRLNAINIVQTYARTDKLKKKIKNFMNRSSLLLKKRKQINQEDKSTWIARLHIAGSNTFSRASSSDKPHTPLGFSQVLLLLIRRGQPPTCCWYCTQRKKRRESSRLHWVYFLF